MKKILFIALFFVFGLVGVAGADVNNITPSTNDINRTNGWAHVDQLNKGIGTTDLQFISTRGFYSCFEYRIDGDTTEQTSSTNYNPGITDGLYPYYCQNNNSSTYTITADEYVEVRMVFGAETDERFDWTRFDVFPVPYARTGEITAPTLDQDVYGTINFTAFLDDDDVDTIQWAVREGSCAAGVGTVFGNVDGHSEIATVDSSNLSHQALSFSGDMSNFPLGVYCFIYNPVEDSGESNIRETVEFNLIKAPIASPIEINQCKNDGWKIFDNPSFKNQGSCVSYVQANEKAGKI